MPARIKLSKQRLLMARMVMEMVRVVAIEYIGTELYGSASADVLLLVAAYIGQAERRPMTANKLASFVGMPRATVVRKLREMQTAGLIEVSGDGTATLPIDKLNEARMVAGIEAAARSIHRSATELSKLDG